MTSILKRMAMLAAALVVAACGGGGGSAGTSPFGGGGGTGGGGGGGTSGQPSITLKLSSSTVTAATPATATATVKDSTGAGLPGQVVNFSTAGGLGVFSATTALTDASGVATVSLRPATATTTGADQVVATATVNGVSLTATAGFQLTATQVAIASFTSDLATLSAYGQATLSVVLSGAPAATPVNIVVSSACVAKGKATLTPTSATTSTGSATFTYRDAGCGATDLTDSLQASVTGTAATASLSLRLTSPAVSSISFSSASPSVIYLKGSGLTETSQVTFQVRDAAGNGLANQAVTLELVTAAGGVTLDGGAVPVSKVSDSLGNVVARINSGTVPTPVRIKASLNADPTIATVSSGLAVAVGLPSQLNFSLSQGTKNIEGLDIDGTPNTYQIIASDRLGNPVPDGTAINFVTEGGQIEAIKQTQTVGGLSRVAANFLTASPRPADGRVTILAYALGEESFLDLNGNNVYDGGELFQDLGDVFLDRGYDGVFDSAVDQFISLSITGSTACAVPASPLLALDVSIPSRPNTCNAEWGKAYVRRAVETVFSSTSARPVYPSKPANTYVVVGMCPSAITLSDYRDDRPGDPTTVVSKPGFYAVADLGRSQLGGLGTFAIILADRNTVRLNPMAAGTTATAKTTDGITASVAGGSPVPSILSATSLAINYKFDTASSGTITVAVRSPSGFETLIPIPVSSGAAPAGVTMCP